MPVLVAIVFTCMLCELNRNSLRAVNTLAGSSCTQSAIYQKYLVYILNNTDCTHRLSGT